VEVGKSEEDWVLNAAVLAVEAMCGMSSETNLLMDLGMDFLVLKASDALELC